MSDWSALLNYPTYSCLCTRADADLDAHIYLSQAHLTHIHICKHLETIEEVEVLDVGTCQHFSKHTNDRVWTVGKYVSSSLPTHMGSEVLVLSVIRIYERLALLHASIIYFMPWLH